MFLSAKAIETHIFHSCSELTLHKLANDRRTEETEDSVFPASSCSKPLDQSAGDPTVLVPSFFKKGPPCPNLFSKRGLDLSTDPARSRDRGFTTHKRSQKFAGTILIGSIDPSIYVAVPGRVLAWPWPSRRCMVCS